VGAIDCKWSYSTRKYECVNRNKNRRKVDLHAFAIGFAVIMFLSHIHVTELDYRLDVVYIVNSLIDYNAALSWLAFSVLLPRNKADNSPILECHWSSRFFRSDTHALARRQCIKVSQQERVEEREREIRRGIDVTLDAV
jgi:hypothetical protein